jgi:LCP family protein required for cell wall assembly
MKIRQHSRLDRREDSGQYGRSGDRSTNGDHAGRGSARWALLGRALVLTLASAVVWGTAHLRSGRRRTGLLLLTLSLTMTAAVATGVAAYSATPLSPGWLVGFAVRPGALAVICVGLLVMALVWSAVIVVSYRLCRPSELPRGARALGDIVAIALCLMVTAPLAYAAKTAYVQRELVSSVFPTGEVASEADPAVGRAGPWAGRRRVNLLLIGGDSAPGRPGVRTDSMTIASIDTKTADTVLFSLPRNLEDAPIPGRRTQFPRGFQGYSPATPGLLNEIWQYAEDRPALVPGASRGDRGPHMLKAVVGEILGLRIDNYVMVNMAGFTGLVDAIGGVRIKVDKTIPCGRNGRPIKPGVRRLKGADAMWYGRCRTHTSDYSRMARQKCLLRAIADQADPTTVLTRFNGLARAAKRAVATDIPRDMLPALTELSLKVKAGAQIQSLQFVPPMIYPGRPDFPLIRQKVNAALRESEAGRYNAQASTGGASSLNLTCPS